MRRPAEWFRGTPRWYRWVAGVAVAIVVLLVVTAFFLDEPLRRLVERQMTSGSRVTPPPSRSSTSIRSDSRSTSTTSCSCRASIPIRP